MNNKIILQIIFLYIIICRKMNNLPLAWRCSFFLDLVIFFFARDINRIIGRHRNVVKLQANYCPCEPFIIFKGKCPKWCTLRHNKWHFHITPKGQRKVCNSICVWSSTLLFSFALEKIRMWVSKVDSNTNWIVNNGYITIIYIQFRTNG